MPTYIAFIDFENAFDRVNWSKVWAVMARKRIPQHLLRAMQSLYVENKILIEAGKPRTAPRIGLINLEYNKGVHYHLTFLIYVLTMSHITGRCVFQTILWLTTLQLTLPCLRTIRLFCRTPKTDCRWVYICYIESAKTLDCRYLHVRLRWRCV